MNILRFLIVILLLLMGTDVQADQSHAALIAEINGLKVQVKYLERRIANLESQNSASSNVSEQNPQTNRHPWRQLSKKMKKKQVIALLGQPGKIEATPFGEYWYYPDIYGGEVHFDERDRLEAWKEP